MLRVITNRKLYAFRVDTIDEAVLCLKISLLRILCSSCSDITFSIAWILCTYGIAVLEGSLEPSPTRLLLRRFRASQVLLAKLGCLLQLMRAFVESATF